jgi:hypothetical protein
MGHSLLRCGRRMPGVGLAPNAEYTLLPIGERATGNECGGQLQQLGRESDAPDSATYLSLVGRTARCLDLRRYEQL